MAMNEQVVAYRRDGKLVCHPCSDIEDRDQPVYRIRKDAQCSICGEPIN